MFLRPASSLATLSAVGGLLRIMPMTVLFGSLEIWFMNSHFKDTLVFGSGAFVDEVN